MFLDEIQIARNSAAEIDYFVEKLQSASGDCVYAHAPQMR